jgi:hypothetical protein
MSTGIVMILPHTPPSVGSHKRYRPKIREQQGHHFSQHAIVGSHRVVVLLHHIQYDPIISSQLNNQVSVIPIIASESGPSLGGSVKFDPEGWRALILRVAHGHRRAPSR